MFKNLSLKTKMFFLVSAVVIVSFLTLTIIVSNRSIEMAQKDAFNLAQETADKYKNEIIAELQGARITAETLSTVFETLKDHNLTDRDMMNDILRNALAKKEYITAFCIAYDPDALDGKDDQYAGQGPAYDETGRYAPYWNKLGGTIDVEFLPDIDSEDWYIVPKAERHEYITDPYPYGLQGKTVMLASLIFPIIHNKEFIGIIASDIVLDKLQEMISKVNPHGQEGYTEIISNSGTIIAHPDKEYLGKDLEEILAYSKEAKDAIKKGEMYISRAKDFYTVYMPIKFSIVTNPWSVAVSIPMAKILNNANRIRNYVILVSLIAICVIATILYFIVQSVTKPILILSETAKTLGEGHFDTEVPLIQSDDEIGALSKAFKFMVEKLNSAMTAAMDASKAKSLFMANMSHEIRTPLNAVIGLNDLLLKTRLDDKQRDYTEKMRSSSATLLRLVNDILDFSDVDSGRMKLENGVFDIRKMFDELQAFFREKNPGSPLALYFELDPALPSSLVGDERRLRQIFINLTGNAYKFTEKGSITIRAAISGRNSNSVNVDFAVEDTGIGMSREQTDKLFSVFTQADNSSTRKYGGAGIELAVTREIVELMGGKISVTSEAGHGTTFMFSCSFPLAGDGAADTRNAVLHGARVLLVEDNEINVMIVMELLNTVGMEVATAQNGKEALDVLADAAKTHGLPPFDVVLMDLQMPVMDGYEATRIIREMPEYNDMPIYALTAHAFPEERERCLRLGMKDHLTKPIDVDLFYSALRNAVASKK
ncbi:hybrid sensor histidine kinase/response regulator [Leadbettera azotonutricia]|uniref:histidine kinase n=1 Tax=Leadbettera azotonutricia (strain ATCC BAA-888 / DSM 13862 / ZAS-9) TaxID=545695 RepID=F5YBW1_LEAAZ|nr:hybrid sensor histidine kinase/response regulator [Leadbettera azotonutricia]AEF82343.1 sensory box histidine kinase/response regulator [Leadbettera azotonutricia ZAS-9]